VQSGNGLKEWESQNLQEIALQNSTNSKFKSTWKLASANLKLSINVKNHYVSNYPTFQKNLTIKACNQLSKWSKTSNYQRTTFTKLRNLYQRKNSAPLSKKYIWESSLITCLTSDPNVWGKTRRLKSRETWLCIWLHEG
jgi:hypothetical protein